jgi:phosphopentomutase
MLLDQLAAVGVSVTAVGKIADIFLNRGIARSLKSKSNADGMAKTLEVLGTVASGFIWVNLVDFDSLYGHRNDVEGYAHALEEADEWIPSLRAALGKDDLAFITADHGCDPTTPSTDHSREYVPLLAFGPRVEPRALATRASLADIGQTIAHNFGATIPSGTAFSL